MDMARKKQMASFTIDRDVLARLDAFVAQHEFPPPKSQIVQSALVEWLDRREASQKAAGGGRK